MEDVWCNERYLNHKPEPDKRVKLLHKETESFIWQNQRKSPLNVPPVRRTSMQPDGEDRKSKKA